MLKRLLVACLLGLAMVIPAGATTVLPLYLDEMIASSAIAFEGTCVENRTERDPGTNFVVTYTTFAVREALKGEVAMTHVIKQIGGRLPDGTSDFNIQGVPKFTPGEEYVVFLAGVSSAGFSSPIGLSQGKFTVVRGPSGAKVTNGRDFRDMTRNIASQQAPKALVQKLQQAAGPVRNLDLDEFKQLVRERAGAAK